ncbi:hypothetical protein ARMSODRAFT_974971 [Armillaria solidipes]|uniref:Uncharacterized protein n=1 Tax=Armillaria solidipes TaxID=1076256 RepID=A0A2H3BJQ0_9AGAR|nr:hypothetical protein ARMSODRAFT_974971 [Armillaria solidipes]
MSFSEHRVIPPPPQKQGEQSTTFLPPPSTDRLPCNKCTTGISITLQTTGKPPVVAILSTSDTITYTTTVMGLQRANYVVFPISPRNSAPAVAHLLHEVGVEHVLVGRDASMQVLSRDALDILGSQYPSSDLPQLSPIPVFEDLFLPDWRTRTNSDDLPLLSVDPSTAGLCRIGSTSSYPKPIAWNCHRLIEHTLVPWFGGRDLCDVVFAVHSLPVYHSMGISQFLWAVSSGLVLGVFEPKTPATSPMLDNMFASAKAMNSDIALSREPDYIDWLSTRSGVLYGGGPLDKEAGDNLTSRGVSIFVLYGSTECGTVTPFLPAKASDCWDYFEFTKFATPKMVADGPDSFELIAVKNKFSEPSVINTNVDGADGFATSDLFTPHPTKPRYWKIIGRIDDQIMHNTGEKRPSCSGAENTRLEFSLNQDLNFPSTPWMRLLMIHYLKRPTVKKINQFAPQHSRLFKEMIIVTKPGRPLTYTAKNTVRRQAALNDYSAEIETLYKTVEDSTRAGILPPLEWDGTSTQEFVRNVVLQTLPRPIPDNADLFQHGCDSLQAIWIRNTLFRALRDSADFDTRQISENFVYSNPSIIQLAEFLISVAQGTQISGADAASRVDAMHRMVQKYSKDFPLISEKHSHALTLEADKVVLVTGTTGGLGCHILANLVLDETVKHIYAVNRPGAVPVTRRQQQTFADHRLEVGIEKIQNSVTHIIHNAWRVDFNLGLSSFESNIRGLHAPEDHPLAEAPVNATVAQGTGYNESKWVSEELLRLAPSLRYFIVRVGQLTGGSKGTWKIKEWVPSMIQSSTVLGFLPDDDKCVSWLPVHIAAQLLVDHIDNSTPIMHLVHPKPVSWSTLARFASQELNVKLVSFSHWLEALENSALDATVLPAMRILPHYKRCAKTTGLRNREAFGLPRLSTTLTQEASIPPLDENEVRNWVQYWREAKMLN